MNPLEATIADFITKKLGNAGQVQTCRLEPESLELLLELKGQVNAVSITVTGLSWSLANETFTLHCTKFQSNLPWLEILAEKWLTARDYQMSWPDQLKFLPLKLKLRHRT